MSLKVHQNSIMKNTINKEKIPLNISRSHQKGFSLFEVLISLVMITFGILSLTNLQTRSVKMSTVAYTETQAALHLQEVVELLRANKMAANNGDYNFALDSFDSFSPGGSTIAEVDRYRWFHNLNSALPGAKASINCDNTSQCVLEIQYDFLETPRKQSLAVIL